MQMNSRLLEQVQVVELTGRLDAHQGKQVDEALAAALRQTNRTVVNLRQVHFIDSTGLAVLVKSMKHHREQSGNLVLCELQQPVRIIFELTRFDKMFAIYPTEADAVLAVD
ncbi:MAG: STAS domain-containing protein [Caldilineaceae bacterium]|nr:STAS domain-containing protein [Caldilineaceae bacterium]